MDFEQLMQQHAADTAFSGSGPFDVFAVPGRRYIGTVIYYMGKPPFVRCDPVTTGCEYASQHRFFPHGLLELPDEV